MLVASFLPFLVLFSLVIVAVVVAVCFLFLSSSSPLLSTLHWLLHLYRSDGLFALYMRILNANLCMCKLFSRQKHTIHKIAMKRRYCCRLHPKPPLSALHISYMEKSPFRFNSSVSSQSSTCSHSHSVPLFICKKRMEKNET